MRFALYNGVTPFLKTHQNIYTGWNTQIWKKGQVNIQKEPLLVQKLYIIWKPYLKHLFLKRTKNQNQNGWSQYSYLFKKNVCKCDFKIIFLQLCSIELRKKGSEAFNIFFVLKLMPNSSQYAKRSKMFGQKFSKAVLFVN